MSETTSPNESTGPTCPPGWVIDWISADRLHRRLAVAGAEVAGIAAPTGPLPPGASYRTHAEHLALRPPAATTERLHAPPAHAAVLWRRGAGAGHGGAVLLEPGAHVHDPTSTPASIQPASAAGRSPFPVRPMVAFVQARPRPFDDRLRVLTNDLLAHDVEARLAVPALPPGAHLTRPCAPVRESLEVLRPDVVLPLDDGARTLVDDWQQGLDAVVPTLELDPTATAATLTGWRRGASRLGARVSPAIAAADLAALVVRLSSAPRPLRAVAVQVR